jgi:hypothetical protein
MRIEATMMDAGIGEGHGTEGRYTFDGPDDLFDQSPINVLKAFMQHVDHVELPAEDAGYEVYAALKSPDRPVVTCAGMLKLAHGDIPFMVMISPKSG